MKPGWFTNPGELRTEIVIKQRTVTSGAGGFSSESYTTLATVLCRWVNAHGSEVWAAEAVQAVQPATVLIRYLSGVDTTCIVTLGGVAYKVVSVDDIHNRHEWMELKVQRMVNG